MEQLITETHEVETVLGQMTDMPRSSTSGLKALQNQVEFVRSSFLRIKRESKFDWPAWFLIAGGAALQAFPSEARHPGFALFLLQKHRLYGAEPLIRWGPVGIVIRIDSKLSRLVNLQNCSPDMIATTSESVIDTQRDIIGYCVLGYVASLKEMNREH